jgi:hypothetical protein
MLINGFLRCEGAVHHWLVRHSVMALRVALGLVFLGFGALKYAPGLSPAQPLLEATLPILTLGVLHGYVGMIVVATLECVIGLSLLSGRGLRGVIYLLGIELLGILSPIVLLPGRIFAGPGGAPTLEGQYVLKDVILVAAAMVVIAASFRNAKIRYPEPPTRTADTASGRTEQSSPTTEATTPPPLLVLAASSKPTAGPNRVAHPSFPREWRAGS